MKLISEGLIGVNLVKPCVYVCSRGLVWGGQRAGGYTCIEALWQE